MSSDAETSSALKILHLTEKRELTDLNDNCLIAIFRYLPLNDLNAETCHRFRDIALNNVYRYHSSVTKFSNKVLAWRYINRENYNNFDDGVECINGYLHRFESIIREMYFDDITFVAPPDPQIYRDIFQCAVDCCSIALKTLQLLSVDLEANTITRGHLLFANLDELELNHCVNWNQVLSMCGNLKSLNLYNPDINRHNDPFNLTYNFPKLRTFQCGRMCPIAGRRSVETFF